MTDIQVNVVSSDQPVIERKTRYTKKVVVLVLLLIVLSGAYYGYARYRAAKQQLAKQQQAVAGAQTNGMAELLGKVGLLIQLPGDEEPSVATVMDEAKLRNEPFFKNASNGDKIIVYTQSLKAILYSPSKNKIINVAPVYFDKSAQSSNASSTPAQAPETQAAEIRIAYYNGTTISGLARTTESKLQQQFANLKTTARTDASKKDYKTTVVVDLSGAFSEQAKTIAQVLGGTLGPLPGGEASPQADILVILGK